MSLLEKAMWLQLKPREFGHWWMELARNLIVVCALIAFAQRSQDWILIAFAVATVIICLMYYVTYLLFDFRSVSRKRLGGIALLYVSIAVVTVYAFAEFYLALLAAIPPLQVPAR
jgi:hypothetical protein